jgi:peroxiredoxin
MKIKLLVAILGLSIVSAHAQKVNSQMPKAKKEVWRAAIHRADSNDIVFNYTLEKIHNKPVITIINGAERMKVDNITCVGEDSMLIKMPVFESAFKAHRVDNDHWEGIWNRGTTSKDIELPFTANKDSVRFPLINGNAKYNITGRWAVSFETDKSKEEGSVGEFVQKGNKLYGTFVTPGGDYRYQEGVVTGDKLFLSGFDGGHAFLFKATIKNSKTIINGTYYSGPTHKEGFKAVKDAKAKVNISSVSMYLKPGEERLNFHFPDLEGKNVSINNERFKNKVVVIQILGSWCPNCMDETAFLSDYYQKNKQRGVEMVALAYEYSTDFNRSVKSLRKLQQRFNIQYPILITGVAVNDTLKTEKTLPQVTNIKVFPSTIFIDKKGRVRKFDTGFFGPGAKEYEEFKVEFYKTMDEMLRE